MKTFKYWIALVLLTLCSPVFAQAEMADTMRAEGKIYVVVAIVLLVLAGVIVYLFLIDRKIKKLENLLNERKRSN